MVKPRTGAALEGGLDSPLADDVAGLIQNGNLTVSELSICFEGPLDAVLKL